MVERKCAGCGKIKNRNELIKITKQNAHHDLVINGDAKYLADLHISVIIVLV